MNIHPYWLKSRTEFLTDQDYQRYTKDLCSSHRLDDGHSYAISISTGHIRKGPKMKLDADKISKSTQQP